MVKSKCEHELRLGGVQETLLLPLWGRSVETMKENSLLIDHQAVKIVESLDYDFSVIAENISKISRASWIARSIYFDGKIKAFISSHPDATVVNIGCGLDTTFDRIDNGRITWIDLDLPDVIDLRRKYIHETDRRTFAAKSVFDHNWHDEVKNKSEIMFMFAGVLYYFEGENVKELFREFSGQFPGVEAVFDYCSVRGMELANKKVIEKGGMDKAASLKWGIDNIFEIEKWNEKIEVIDTMPMFREHKKNYPLLKRLGMSISDAMKIMSLAHIRIG